MNAQNAALNPHREHEHPPQELNYNRSPAPRAPPSTMLEEKLSCPELPLLIFGFTAIELSDLQHCTGGGRGGGG